MYIVCLARTDNDNDWYAVYEGTTMLYSYRGQDALSIVLEWRADAQS